MLNTIFTIIQVLCCLALIAIIMLQTGKNGLSGAITGATESFMTKNKSVGKEAKLTLFTKIVGIAFVVLTLVLNLI